MLGSSASPPSISSILWSSLISTTGLSLIRKLFGALCFSMLLVDAIAVRYPAPRLSLSVTTVLGVYGPYFIATFVVILLSTIFPLCGLLVPE